MDLKLDLEDRKLLFALDGDASKRFSVLARELDLPRELVRYRVLRFEREGLMAQTACAPDFDRLGFVTYQLLLKLHSVNEAQIRDLAKRISARRGVAWLARVEGDFQLEIVFRVPNPLALGALLDDILREHGALIAKRLLMVNLDQRHLSRDYLLNRKKRKRLPTPQALAGKEQSQFAMEQLDSVDTGIVRLLQQSARQGPKQLADGLAEVNTDAGRLSAEGIARRVRQLEERGVIQGYLLVLDNRCVEQLVFRVFFAFNHDMRDARRRFLSAAVVEPRCVFYARTIGEWDVQLEFEVQSSEQLREILARISAAAPGTVRDYSVLEQVERYRFNLVFD